jgi:hypothetical protein
MKEEPESTVKCPLCSCLEWMTTSPIGRSLLRARREVLRAVRDCADRRIDHLDDLLGGEPEVHSVKVE